MKKIKLIFSVVFAVFLIAAFAFADEVLIKMYLLNDQGMGKELGTVTASDTQHGLLLVPVLSDIPPGLHGFHVHQNPDCSHALQEGKSVAGLAAGGHYDPSGTNRHKGPYGNGHLGDLPALYAGADGKVTLPVLAPRLKVSDIRGRSLMIHSGGDNYSDEPEKLGGGGPRIACGVVK